VSESDKKDKGGRKHNGHGEVVSPKRDAGCMTGRDDGAHEPVEYVSKVRQDKEKLLTLTKSTTQGGDSLQESKRGAGCMAGRDDGAHEDVEAPDVGQRARSVAPYFGGRFRRVAMTLPCAPPLRRRPGTFRPPPLRYDGGCSSRRATS
jgi:hypothetical protein